eukprot:403352018
MNSQQTNHHPVPKLNLSSSILNQNLINQNSSVMNNSLLSSSLTFNPSILTATLNLQTERLKQEDELSQMRKEFRAKTAEFNKDKALLVQQLELLQMHLQESKEKEVNLKKVNENIMHALQNQENQREKSFEIDINEDHPKVASIIREIKQDHQIYMQKIRDQNRESEYQLQKENQQLQFKLLDAQNQNQLLNGQLESNNQEFFKLQQKHQQELNEMQVKLIKESDELNRKYQYDIDAIMADIDRQVNQKLNERLCVDQDMNEQIIKLQKELQINLDEQKNQKSKINYLERELEQLEDKNRKTEDENSSLKIKMKQNEKKVKVEQDQSKKQLEEYEKLIESFEKQFNVSKRTNNPSLQKKALNTFGVKSRNKINSIFNKENIFGNKSQPVDLTEDEDEEKNKLRRQISLFRCQLKKLEIEIRDIKSKTTQEINQLKDKLNVERKKRMNIYEDKIDKNNQLLQDLLEKDQTIFTLNREISKLQEKLQNFTGNLRGATPNHLLSSSLHESAIHTNNVLTNSMADLFTNQASNRLNHSKRMISPLRSLDLNLLSQENISALNGLSFSLLPIQSCKGQKSQRQNSKKKIQNQSPKQIKRTRINSVQVSNRTSNNNLAASMNFMNLRQSRDASIKEVNEDLYKDSVHTTIDCRQKNPNTQSNITNDIYNLQQSQIMLGFENPQKAKHFYTSRQSTDSELTKALNFNSNQPPQNNNYVYQDSLENLSQSSGDDQNRELYNQYKLQSNHHQAQQSTYQKFNSYISSQDRRKAKEIHEQTLKKHKSKIMEDKTINEDDDCLVNILDQEDTNIEVQPTISHTRQHLSTENLFRESQNTIETLNSFRNHQMQKQLRDITRQKQASIPLPRPQKTGFQKGAVQKIIQVHEQPKVTRQDSIQFDSYQKNPLSLNESKLLKSPSSPNVMPSISNSGNQPKQLLRNDSCPSPLDENETEMTLGSGEKLRIKEINFQSLEAYQNQFKEQRHKFSATIKPNQMNHVTNRNQAQNESMIGICQNKGGQFQFRTRTNSLINSCSEISFKMKFVTDKPQNQATRFDKAIPSHPSSNFPQSSKNINSSLNKQPTPTTNPKKAFHHQRVPSMQLQSHSSSLIKSGRYGSIKK